MTRRWLTLAPLPFFPAPPLVSSSAAAKASSAFLALLLPFFDLPGLLAPAALAAALAALEEQGEGEDDWTWYQNVLVAFWAKRMARRARARTTTRARVGNHAACSATSARALTTQKGSAQASPGTLASVPNAKGRSTRTPCA